MKKTTYKIIQQSELASGIFDLRLQAPEIAAAARPGQFVNVYCPGADKLLPRPISLCEVDAETGEIRLVYRVAGKGTAELAQRKAGDSLAVLGPLGNGFPLEEAWGRRVLLVGGGVGIPPMLETAKALGGSAQVTAVLGYRDELFLLEDLRAVAPVAVSVEQPADGALPAELPSVRGNVLDAIREGRLSADLIFACGPKPMLRALKRYAEEEGIACYLSLEERMACGVGACLACVCRSAAVDAHTGVRNKRVCKDGPVFDAREVEL